MPWLQEDSSSDLEKQVDAVAQHVTRLPPMELPTSSDDESSSDLWSDLEGQVEAAKQDMPPPPPIGEWGEPRGSSSLCGRPSLGSALHAEGACTPCRFEKTGGFCHNGDQCEFCHLHPDYKRKHPSKQARDRAKARLRRAMEQEQQQEQQQQQEELRRQQELERQQEEQRRRQQQQQQRPRSQSATRSRRWQPVAKPAVGAPVPLPPGPVAGSGPPPGVKWQ